MTREQVVEMVARLMVRARGCDDKDAALAQTNFPCPFCFWPAEAGEESGCIFWAEEIITALQSAGVLRLEE